MCVSPEGFRDAKVTQSLMADWKLNVNRQVVGQ